MNQNLYKSAIFFLALYMVCSLFHTFIYFQMGSQSFFLQTFATWFLILNIISLVGSLFLLKYFHYRKYRFAFWSATATTLLLIWQSILIYLNLIWAMSELGQLILIAVSMFLISGIFFSISLIVSRAGERYWLKIEGIFMLVVYVVYASTIIGSMLSREFVVAGTFEKTQQWIALVSSFMPLFFILNFRSELKSLQHEEEKEKQLQYIVFLLSGIIAVAIAFSIGGMVAREASWGKDWNQRAAEVNEELARPFEHRTYVSDKGDALNYLFLKPLHYNSEQKYPLVVCLHGGTWMTPSEERHIEVPQPAPLLSKPENREKYRAFLFVPQAPSGHSWGGYPGFPAADSLIVEAIYALEEEYTVDKNRRYVAGGSGGGYGSWHLIGTRPDMFAAAIPFCGAGDPDLAPNMIDVAVWAFHGRVDRNVPVSGSREIIEAIKKAGGTPSYTEFPEVGHNIWPHIAATPGLLDWLFEQRRI